MNSLAIRAQAGIHADAPQDSPTEAYPFGGSGSTSSPGQAMM
jgi:hypothetical protein